MVQLVFRFKIVNIQRGVNGGWFEKPKSRREMTVNSKKETNSGEKETNPVPTERPNREINEKGRLHSKTEPKIEPIGNTSLNHAQQATHDGTRKPEMKKLVLYLREPDIRIH
jgi:hypothetical protein